LSIESLFGCTEERIRTYAVNMIVRLDLLTDVRATLKLAFSIEAGALGSVVLYLKKCR